ncbi:MAG TPA: hypothetical protein VNX23_11515 [Bradyrhizobium sp.]|uniref:hypothetical protein n=1 Tax=Bradyrhizobium sp. TaxID=376 RepID=UPI002C98DF8D|nr:hypothetical protein [Bradyrhizobium sp.]HXB78010.1 hypothetical protein [Bradyrhizobium sp.]
MTGAGSRAQAAPRRLCDHDQMSGTLVRDEQGTRHRPYDLIVEFDKEKIDDLLRALASSPGLRSR